VTEDVLIDETTKKRRLDMRQQTPVGDRIEELAILSDMEGGMNIAAPAWSGATP
jgi:hypothetical protein